MNGLADLAQHLAGRRAALLDAWRAMVRRDPDLTSGRALSRAQVNDHIPALLAAFEADLARPPPPGAASPAAPGAEGQAHGLHRWQQGYDLGEVTRELGRLNECVADELEAYADAHPALPRGLMAEARRRWARAYTVAVAESTEKFFHLQQLEAAGHIEELEAALDDLLEIERLRAGLWQQAAHDLRGNVAVVANATAGLASDPLPAAVRERFLSLLQRNVASLNHLLGDVTSLARLQAGEEHRVVAPFDAAALLRELCHGLTGIAEERGLALHCSGPQTLMVEGDAVKTRRIAQNLVLNALAYTPQGRVDLAWGDAGPGDDKRWRLTLHDTGPGLGPGAGLAGALERATAQAPGAAPPVDTPILAPEAAVVAPARAPHRAVGEGLGLSIVKRLSDLLDASVEVESQPGLGTTFRILFPRGYGA